MSVMSESQNDNNNPDNIFKDEHFKYDDPFADYQNQFANAMNVQFQRQSDPSQQKPKENPSDDPFKNFQPINLAQPPQQSLHRKNSTTSQDTEQTTQTQTTAADLKPRTFNNITNNNQTKFQQQQQQGTFGQTKEQTENITKGGEFFPQNTFLNPSNNQENIYSKNQQDYKKDLPPNYIPKNYLDSKLKQFSNTGGYLNTLSAMNNNNIASTGSFYQQFSPYKPQFLQQPTTTLTPNTLLSSMQKNATNNISSFQPLQKKDYSQFVNSNLKGNQNYELQNAQMLDKQKLTGSFLHSLQGGQNLGAGGTNIGGTGALGGMLGGGTGVLGGGTGILGGATNFNQSLNAGIDTLLNCQTEEIFTDDVIFLLSDEDSNLASYREIIENEKAKLTKDVDMIIHDIVNQFENIKFQVVQAINEHYKLYVENYQEFKKNIQDFRNVRLEVQNYLSTSQITQQNIDYSQVSNANLIKELQDLKQKNQYSKLIVQLVSQKQKEHYNKISHLSKNILARLSSVQNYYNSEYFLKQLNIIKQSLSHQAENSIKNIEQIVRPPISDLINQRVPFSEPSQGMQQQQTTQQQTTQQQTTLTTGHFQTQQHQEDLFPERQQQQQQQQQPQNQPIKILENQQSEISLQNNTNFSLTNQSYLQNQMQQYQQQQQQSFQLSRQGAPQPFIFEEKILNKEILGGGNIDQQPLLIIPQQNSSSTFSFIKPIQQQIIQPSSPTTLKVLNQQSFQKNIKFSTPYTLQTEGSVAGTVSGGGGVLMLQPIAFQQQLLANLLNNNRNCEINNVNGINLQLTEIIQTSHKDIVLCVTVVNNLIATGSKDSSIELWNPITKQKCGTLYGHSGSICSLGIYKNNQTNYLMSGSDHGDCSVIVWDLTTLQIVKKLEGHKAAVVNLIALQDEQTIISSSYDRDIIFWNVNLGKEVQRLSDHKSSITTMTLQKDNRRLISAGLDNEINIWNIEFKSNQVFDQCSLERIIQNNSFVCTLNTCFFNNENLLIGGDKDGKISVWNLNNGNLQKQISVNIGPIVELLVFQSMDKQNMWFICCSTGDDNIIVSHYNYNQNAFYKSRDNLFVEYGCGVNYKMQFANINNQMKVVAVNQNENQRKFTIWNLTTM